MGNYERAKAATELRPVVNIKNSLYGTLLNESFRMYNQSLGQSTTLTGRSIVRHMNARINEIITGSYDYRGEAIIYSDTDSGFFSAYKVLKDHPDYQQFDWTPETVIGLYDAIAEDTNATFAAFMDRTFHTGLERGGIISAGRELVGHGLFIKKKKYAILMYDKEGKRLDVNGAPGQLKVMGLDLKRADTPKVMQEFLKKLLLDVLVGVPREQMYDDVRQFRISFKARPAWEKGSPKKVANLSEFAAKQTQSNKRGLSLTTKIRAQEKLRVTMPGHVRASLNWNMLCDLHGDRHATRISDSNRIIVCKLAANPMRLTSIAYPMDESHLPFWFKEMPFDEEAMEETIIDNKIMNLVGVLDWNLTDTKLRAASDLFSWSA